MKNLITLVFALAAFATATFAQNSNHVYVNGYTKSDGTYVQGHYRTAPNSTINDNFSTYPNVNPYTGQQGTISPSYYYDYTPSRSSSNSNSYYNTYTTPSYPSNTKSDSYYNNWKWQFKYHVFQKGLNLYNELNIEFGTTLYLNLFSHFFSNPRVQWAQRPVRVQPFLPSLRFLKQHILLFGNTF